MSDTKFTSLDDGLYNYLLQVSSRESQALQKIRLANDLHPQIRMQISPDQAQFLQFLIRLIKAQRVLEIGCFLGYSAAAMAEALPEHGLVITCDADKNIQDIAETNWLNAKLNNKIELKIGHATDILQELFANHLSFDFIFIDADKINYPVYYQFAKKLLSNNGIIAIDNVFFHGEVLAEKPSKSAKAIDDFNHMLYRDSDVYISMLPIADGLTLVQKK